MIWAVLVRLSFIGSQHRATDRNIFFALFIKCRKNVHKMKKNVFTFLSHFSSLVRVLKSFEKTLKYHISISKLPRKKGQFLSKCRGHFDPKDFHVM